MLAAVQNGFDAIYMDDGGCQRRPPQREELHPGGSLVAAVSTASPGL